MANKCFSASEWEWVWARIFYMQQCVILYYTYMYCTSALYFSLYLFDLSFYGFTLTEFRIDVVAWPLAFQYFNSNFVHIISIYFILYFFYFFLLVLLNYIFFHYSAHVHESDHSIAYYFDIKLTIEGRDKVQCFSTLSKLTSNI